MHGAEAALVVIVILLMAAFAFGGYLVGRGHQGGGETTTGQTTTGQTTTGQTTTAAGGATGNADAGQAVFVSAGCGGCHTLAATNATGTVGPSLDTAKPSEARVVDRVTNGMGAMPPFEDQLSEQQIADVAAYVHAATSK